MSYPFVQSPYFQSRNNRKVIAIVIHTMVGTYEGTIQYFKNNSRQVSAHYCLSLEGAVTQMVDLSLGANHAGNVDKPVAKVVLANPGINPNWYTVGIENADDSNPAGADRSKQMPGLAKLVAELCTQFNLPANRDTIIGHREIYSIKTCPGNIDLNDLVKRVQTILGGTMPSTLQTYLGVQTDTEAMAKLQEHLGVRDGKCDWGNSSGHDTGGYLGSARREIDSLKATHDADVKTSYDKGFADGVASVPSTNLPQPTPPVDMSNYEENGLAVETTVGNTKYITNYKKVK